MYQKRKGGGRAHLANLQLQETNIWQFCSLVIDFFLVYRQWENKTI